jgi:hypothetical protein
MPQVTQAIDNLLISSDVNASKTALSALGAATIDQFNSSITFLFNITTTEGSGTNSLVSIASSDLPLNKIVAFKLDNVLTFWQLVDIAPSSETITPSDYSTSGLVWIQVL